MTMSTSEKRHDQGIMSEYANNTDGELKGSDVGQIEYASEENHDTLRRRLGNRQIQLIAIGGSIGTATFVSVGSGLAAGGPASLLLAFILATTMMGFVNNSMAEMAIYMPVSGSFIGMASHWVDESLGFLAGWNFFIYEAILVPFEISALNLVLSYWRDDIPVEAVIAACIVLYLALNFFAVKYYGEAEFWLSIGKFLLFLIVFGFTLVTMCGGNPKHDAYGFRHWRDPGPFAEYIGTGSLGRFEGFLAALWTALFTVCGPEYMAMVAGETKHPRKFLKSAFKTTFYRFVFFFVGTSLCVGIVVAYNDPMLVSIINGTSEGSGTAAASPYVIAMSNLGIGILPHVTSALLVTSIFSAGNAYTYCGSRSLYGLAVEGKAPAFLRHCNKAGVPIYCLFFSIAFSLLAFLQSSSNTATVLDWLINILSTCQIINYIIICITYLHFYRATSTQGFDHQRLPYKGLFQPYGTWIALAFYVTAIFVRGYSVFLPGKWSLGNFFTNYTMVGVAPCVYLFWKLLKRTKVVKAEECDLIWDAPLIDAYEAASSEIDIGFWREIAQIVGISKKSRVHHSGDA